MGGMGYISVQSETEDPLVTPARQVAIQAGEVPNLNNMTVEELLAQGQPDSKLRATINSVLTLLKQSGVDSRPIYSDTMKKKVPISGIWQELLKSYPNLAQVPNSESTLRAMIQASAQVARQNPNLQDRSQLTQTVIKAGLSNNPDLQKVTQGTWSEAGRSRKIIGRYNPIYPTAAYHGR